MKCFHVHVGALELRACLAYRPGATKAEPTHQDLRALTDHQLRDIGLRRDQTNPWF